MIHRTFISLLLLVTSALLASCVATGPYPGVPILGATPPPRYKGTVAAPQVGYRIDENRYFEIVPRADAACYRAGIFYTDKAQGIHTQVMGIDQLGGIDLVIDAANTQYLVAPIIKGGGSCYTCGGSWLNVDLNKINPVLGRELVDCPDRMYYVHAARRLAFLVKEIRDGYARKNSTRSHPRGRCSLKLNRPFSARRPGARSD